MWAASATPHTQLEIWLSWTALWHLQVRFYWNCKEDRSLHHYVSLNTSEGSTPNCLDCEHCKYFINSGKPKSEINKPRSHLHYKELLYCRTGYSTEAQDTAITVQHRKTSQPPQGGVCCPTCCCYKWSLPCVQLLCFSGSGKWNIFSLASALSKTPNVSSKGNQVSKAHTWKSQRG